MDRNELRNLLKVSIYTAVKAGKEISKVYNSNDLEIELKPDNSPLTRADKVSHQIIIKGLDEAASQVRKIPVLSEEGRDISYEERKEWSLFWLVDPLDGTKEFIKHNGEFTVNIALVENNEPILGVIYAPAYNQVNWNVRNQVVSSSFISKEDANCNDNEWLQECLNGVDAFPGTIYFAAENEGAFKAVGKELYRLNNKSFVPIGNKLTAVSSRSHSSDEEKKKLEDLGVNEFISVGSSLKFCLVAEAKAQVYFRYGPTMEWDVGAGYSIAKEADIEIKGLTFNKENLLNGSFSAIRKSASM